MLNSASQMSSSLGAEPVAIVGVACRLPGANSPQRLWRNLRASKDIRGSVSRRFNPYGFYEDNGGQRKGLTNVQQAYFLDQDLDEFDAAFFGISPIEAGAMDPQHRILLEVTYEAMEAAGIPVEAIRGTDTGVYTGIFGTDFATALLRGTDEMPRYTSTGISNAIASNRISYTFDLHGPNFAVDTACSSTAVALHQAILNLRANESKIAIVCGSNLILNPDMFIHMSELGFLSPDGLCKAFDKNANGYARGEGVACLILKPLNLAIFDNDPIQAIIRGTNVNQDGKTQGISQPSAVAQEENAASLYRRLGIDPAHTQYVEAHGTGTQAGDCAEMSAIRTTFSKTSKRSEDLIVGSVKSNIGHLEATAALASIIKIIQCFKHNEIPPQMHFRQPNPKIDFGGIQVPTGIVPWHRPPSGSRRASLNSFGYGGTNGHIVLEDAPLNTEATQGRAVNDQFPLLFALSAASDASLQKAAELLAEYIEENHPSLDDLAYTLLCRRSMMSKTWFTLARDSESLAQKLRLNDVQAMNTNVRHKKLIYVFTGQGAQWPLMAEKLIQDSTRFRKVIDECDCILQSLPTPPEWSALSELLKPRAISRLYEGQVSQPLCTIVQIALVMFLRFHGVAPHSVVGHSSGEIGAAYCAGMISIRDAVAIAYYRGLCLQSLAASTILPKPGAMCAVGRGKEQITTILQNFHGRLSLAAVNSPHNCTVSGDVDAMDGFIELCKSESIFCRKLRVDIAYHSHHMESLAHEYKGHMLGADISQERQRCYSATMYSSVFGRRVEPFELTPEYWIKNMTSTVRFSDALYAASDSDSLTFVEVGPHPALEGPVKDSISSRHEDDVLYIGTLKREHDDSEMIQKAMGLLVVNSLPVTKSSINSWGNQETVRNVISDLPGYAWDHSHRHWFEPCASQSYRFRPAPRHVFLGSQSYSENTIYRSWRNVWHRSEVLRLIEFRSGQFHIASASICLTMALEAARQISGGHYSCVKLRDVMFPVQLPVETLQQNTDRPLKTELHVRKEDSTTFTFSLLSNTADRLENWQICCSGGFQLLVTPERNEDIVNLVKRNIASMKVESSLTESTPFPGRLTIRDSFALGSLDVEDTVGDISDERFLRPLLQLLQTLSEGRNSPGIFKLSQISSVTMTLAKMSILGADIAAHVVTKQPNIRLGHLLVQATQHSILEVHDARLDLRQLSRLTPLKNNLFITPQWRTDISLTPKVQLIDVMTLLKMLCHKWTMADIGLFNVDHKVCLNILSSLTDESSQLSFRSIVLSGCKTDGSVANTATVEPERFRGPFHVVFCDNEHVRETKTTLTQDGILAVLVQGTEYTVFEDDDLDSIGRVKASFDRQFLLYRVQAKPPDRISNRVRCFCHHAMNENLQSLLHQRIANLSIDSDARGVDDVQFGEEQHEGIALDNGHQSMLIGHAKHVLLPWMQSLLGNIQLFLWITINADRDPLKDVAGSCMRTIANENPAVSIACLSIKDNMSDEMIVDIIVTVLRRLRDGSAETEIIFKDNEFHCLRYYPDNHLSHLTGVCRPSLVPDFRGEGNHQIVLGDDAKPYACVDRFPRNSHISQAMVRVTNKFSAVDHVDLAAAFHKLSDYEGLGHFLGGIVCQSASNAFAPNDAVVGYCPGAHRNSIDVPASQLIAVSSPDVIPEALVSFATHFTAIATLEYTARIRRRDAVRLQLPHHLREIFRYHFKRLGAIEVFGDEFDFFLEYDAARGLRINGQHLAPHSLHRMSQDQSSMALLSTDLSHKFNTRSFPVSDVAAAFEEGRKAPFQTLLSHGTAHNKMPCILQTRDSLLFECDGAYVLVGGSGGLGRHVSLWMASRGARNIFIITRTMKRNHEIDQWQKDMRHCGANLEILSGDAAEYESLENHLCSIRSRMRIIGCINMAMVLHDAPFLSTSIEQWEQTLEAKVRTTLNLHRASLVDAPALFIVFSSLASLLGNRMQAAYATANSYQNAFAHLRRSQGLASVSIALGPVSEIGVLSENSSLKSIYINSGLRLLSKSDLEKMLQAAVQECYYPSHRVVIGAGLRTLKNVNGHLRDEHVDANQCFWAEMAEFSPMIEYCHDSKIEAVAASLRDRIRTNIGDAHQTLLKEIITFLSSLIGLPARDIRPATPLAQYGLDSLSAVSFRYWIFKELEIDLSVFDILSCKSIDNLASRILSKCEGSHTGSGTPVLPEPKHYEYVEDRVLSHSQERLWVLHNCSSNKTLLNLLLVCRLEGHVVKERLRQAWTVFTGRHEILHSRLTQTKSGLRQIPTAHPSFRLETIAVTDAEFNDKAHIIKGNARAYEFDLEQGEFLRGWLLESPQKTLFFLASHHLAWDRQSSDITFQEVRRIYKNLTQNREPEDSLPRPPFQFIDYALWERSLVDNELFIRPHLEYWKARLEGAPQYMNLLPTAHVQQRPTFRTFEPGRTSWKLDKDTASRIRQYCKRQGSTPFMFAAATLVVLLSRLSRDSDIVIGIADNDRHHSAFDQLVGYTVDMLPIRSQVLGDETFVHFTDRFRQVCLSAYEHSILPFNVLVQHLNIPRSSSHAPLFQVVVNYQTHGTFPEYDYGDFQITDYEHYNARQQADLVLEMEEGSDGSIACALDYDLALYTGKAASKLAGQYRAAIEFILACDGKAVMSQLDSALTDGQHFIRSILEPDVDLHQITSLQRSLLPTHLNIAAQESGDKLAVQDTTTSLNYRALRRESSKISTSISHSTLSRGSGVALFSDSNVNAVVTVHGILRAGCVFVPIDTDLPDVRISSILADSSVDFAFVDCEQDRQRMVKIGLVASHVRVIGDILSSTTPECDDEDLLDLHPHDLACYMFTSGSTGQPKGFALSHFQLRCAIEGACKSVGVVQQDKTLLSSSFAFDASFYALFGSIITQGSVYVASKEERLSPPSVVDIVVYARITNVLMTPTQLDALLNCSTGYLLRSWRHLRSAVVGGERMRPGLVQKFYALDLPEAVMYNAYGPGETTLMTSVKRLKATDALHPEVPLAGPCFPSRFYILDDNLQRVPVGQAGELYIAGPTVASGYLKRDKLTETSFIHNHLQSQEPGSEMYKRLYRTGDVFRLDDQGVVTMRGRVHGSRQIKIRGMRTELDEIETALWDCAARGSLTKVSVTNVAVIARQTAHDSGMSLVAYLETADHQNPCIETIKGALRQSLLDQLPLHLVPSLYGFVPSIPRSISGKTDYQTLQTWPDPSLNHTHGDAIPTEDLHDVEKEMTYIWKAILHLSPTEILTHESDFFALGGHSMLLLGVQQDIEERLAIRVSLSELFAASKLGELSDLIRHHQTIDSESVSMQRIDQSGGENGHRSRMSKHGDINWEQECALHLNLDSVYETSSTKSFRVISMTGASSMVGAYLLGALLDDPDVERVYCVAEDGRSDEEASISVRAALERWKAGRSAARAFSECVTVYRGSLEEAQLGLSDRRWGLLNSKADTIFHLAATVSLFKNYTALRAGNVGTVRTLLSLAQGLGGKSKRLHHLSTWGVPHLQTWYSTQFDMGTSVVKSEDRLGHMRPGSEDDLGYLKARWASEMLLEKAAEVGIDVSIYRASMCAASENSSLERGDINRRTVVSFLKTKMVPDWGSEQGGGMSWIDADFLCQSMHFLAKRKCSATSRAAKRYHLVSDAHLRYADMAKLLSQVPGHMGVELVPPSTWSEALRKQGDRGMKMHAEVLEKWWESGWIPFELEAQETLTLLKDEAGLTPPRIDVNFLLHRVVGSESF